MTRIRELRNGQGVSLIAMSHGTGIHPSTLSSMERRKLAPAGHVRAAVSAFLGVQEDVIFDSDGLAA